MKHKKIFLSIVFVISYVGFLYLDSYTTVFQNVALKEDSLLYASNIYYKDSLDEYFIHEKKYKNRDIEILPGAMLLLLIQDKNLDMPYISSIQAVLQDKNKKIKTKVQFLSYKDEQYYAVLPIPHTLNPEEYRIVVEAVIDETKLAAFKNKTLFRKKVSLPQKVEFPIMINKRNINEDTLYLNKKLAKRKSSQADPEVVKQAKEIWAITGSPNPESRYALSDYMLPLKTYKYLTGMFSDRRVYVYPNHKRVNGRAHGGMDIAAPVGTPVYAAATGRVVLAKDRIITGKSVVIEHFPGVFSMYYHMDSIAVEPDAIIMKGTKVGTVGNTGFSTGAHLHWEMRVNNVRVDPLLTIGELDNIKFIDILYK